MIIDAGELIEIQWLVTNGSNIWIVKAVASHLVNIGSCRSSMNIACNILMYSAELLWKALRAEGHQRTRLTSELKWAIILRASLGASSVFGLVGNGCIFGRCIPLSNLPRQFKLELQLDSGRWAALEDALYNSIVAFRNIVEPRQLISLKDDQQSNSLLL